MRRPLVRLVSASTAAVLLALCVPSADAQTIATDHKFEPWAWDFQTTNSSGFPLWKRHLFWEDNANTAFVLAQELVQLPGQSGSHPEVVLFNQAQFIPPDGVALDVQNNQLRKIARGSVDNKGVQIYVNARNAPIGTLSPPCFYPDPTFFVGVKENDQIDTNLWSLDVTLGADPVSATRGAFGTLPPVASPLVPTVPAYTVVPLHHQQAIPSYSQGGGSYVLDALYITAGVGYAMDEFEDQTLAHMLERDRLLRYDAVNAAWIDESWRVPLDVRTGHSSGVCWADFDGDGFLDLFVGLTGDDYAGAQNYLLLYDEANGDFDIANPTMMLGNQPYVREDATWDVAAGDVDHNGYPDIVVANRRRRNQTLGVGAESIDYCLFNHGNAKFSLVELSPHTSDTRSVALGDLYGDASLEIVLGNAGSEGYGNELAIAPADDDPLQAYAWKAITNSFVSVGALLLPGTDEVKYTKPLTQQVLIADVTRPQPTPLPQPPFENGPDSTVPDAKPDILLVNGRDILQADDAPSGNVTVLANDMTTTAAPLKYVGTVPVPWARCAALADFCAGDGAEGESLDLFVGTGNRFHGTDSALIQNLGNATNVALPFNINADTPFVQAGSYDRMPGAERGYGFDFGDCNGDGFLDAAQASRAYNFFVPSIYDANKNDHLDFIAPGLTGATDNRRGQLMPRTMEDAAFADFNGDFWPDVITVGDGQPSQSIADPNLMPNDAFSSMLKLFRNDGTGHSAPFVREDEGEKDWVNFPNAAVKFKHDKRVDPSDRTAFPSPGLFDRVVPGDLNNDGKTDAIAHAFDLQNPAVPNYVPVLGAALGQYLPPGFPPNTPESTILEKTCFGFMYLENVYDPTIQPPTFQYWLKDVFNSKMRTSASVGVSGVWNRGNGNDALIDIDNNGALDLYTTNGRPHTVGGTIATRPQTQDLVFMNQGSPDWGVLVALPAATPTIYNIYGIANQPPESFGLAWGDVDNDGRVDVVTTHAFGAPRAYPSLLMNTFDPNAPATPYFADQYTSKVPVTAAALDDSVHSIVAPDVPANLLDEAKFPCLFDFDADGDLDLVLAIGNNVPRFFQNVGSDMNGDGVIGSGEGAGTFVDATDELCRWIRPTVDCHDMAAIDPDRDGDLDLALDPFNDEVVFWRNDLPQAVPPESGPPSVTDAMPRPGCRRGDWIVLTGNNMATVNYVELRFANSQVQSISGADVVIIDSKHMKVKLPTSSPVGLAQVRIRKRTNQVNIWSKQYFGYFVLLRKP